MDGEAWSYTALPWEMRPPDGAARAGEGHAQVLSDRTGVEGRSEEDLSVGTVSLYDMTNGKGCLNSCGVHTG